MSLAKDYRNAKGVGIGGIFCGCCADRSSKGKHLTRRRNRRKVKIDLRNVSAEGYDE